MEWPTIIIALVALYGAIFSTWTFYCQRREKRRFIKVELSIGLLMDDPEVSEAMVLISARNSGDRSVNLNTVGILLPKKKRLVMRNVQGDIQLPCEFSEGKSCTVWKEAKQLANNLASNGYSGTVKLVGYYQDALGVTYKSRPYKCNIEEWK